jgi:hypothetical protein
VDFPEEASSGHVSVYASNVCGNSPATPVLNVIVRPIPTAPEITYDSKKNKLSSNTGQGNQWYLNGNIIPGANNKTYTPVQPGSYTDIVTQQGCSSPPSNAIYVTPPLQSAPAVLAEEEAEVREFAVYPNPNLGMFYYEITLPEEETVNIEISSSAGSVVYRQKDIHVKGTVTGEIHLETLAEGVYVMRLYGDRTLHLRKIVINR